MLCMYTQNCLTMDSYPRIVLVWVLRLYVRLEYSLYLSITSNINIKHKSPPIRLDGTFVRRRRRASPPNPNTEAEYIILLSRELVTVVHWSYRALKGSQWVVLTCNPKTLCLFAKDVKFVVDTQFRNNLTFFFLKNMVVRVFRRSALLYQYKIKKSPRG